MNVLGAHLPVSGWTFGVLAAGLLVSAVVYRSRRGRPRAFAAFATALSLTVALALTVTPEGTASKLGIAACIPYDWNDLIFTVLHTGGGVFASLLNLFLIFPLALSLVLATRMVWPALVVGVLLPALIELVQTQLPGRSCTISDLLANIAGALVGTAAGWLIDRRVRRPVRRLPGRSPTTG